MTEIELCQHFSILAMNIGVYKNDDFHVLGHLTLNVIFLSIHSYSTPPLLSTCHSTLKMVGAQ